MTEATAERDERVLAEHVTAYFVKVGHVVTVNEQEARRGIDLALEQFPTLLFNLRVEFRTDILLNQGLLLQQQLSKKQDTITLSHEGY